MASGLTSAVNVAGLLRHPANEWSDFDVLDVIELIPRNLALLKFSVALQDARAAYSVCDDTLLGRAMFVTAPWSTSDTDARRLSIRAIFLRSRSSRVFLPIL